MKLARQWLADSLATFGLGAKTAAGYGGLILAGRSTRVFKRPSRTLNKSAQKIKNGRQRIAAQR